MQLAGQARRPTAGVTAREAETLEAIGQRLTNREIAARMFISVRTVESHVSSLLRKLALPDRPALVLLAQQLPRESALPASPTSFVGRDEEVAELNGMLATSALVTLIGPAGCGKTRLALEAARGWPGEARVADLSSAGERDVAALIAAGLGIGYEARDMIAAARVAHAGSNLLMVVDNCEHVLAAAATTLGALARAVPGLHLLATSREPLGIDVERVLPVRPLGAPAGPQPGDVRASAAGQLFLDRALAASPRFRLDEVTAPQVAAICHRLDGLPLAIELAAARVRNFDVMELADGLKHRSGVLERPAGAGRHRSLSAAIEWSWQLLDETERGLLRRLAVLPGEFTLALAEIIGPGPAAGEVRSTLMRLTEQSLVAMRLPAGEPARYWLLAVIRAFVVGRAGPADDDEVARAHALFFCDAAEAAAHAHYHPTPTTPPRVGFDEPNFLAALAWSAAHDPGLADRLLLSICRLTELEPSRQALEVICDVASHSPPRWSSETLARASVTVAFLSLDHAELLAGNSRLAAASERDEAFACWAAGWVHAYRHRESAAVRSLGRAISYARGAADPWLEASALQARGVARTRAEDAFADWEQAVIRFVVAGDLTHASNVRYMLASRAVETHARLEDVPVWLDGCQSYASSHGLKHELAHIRLARAGYQLITGRPDEARRLLDAALPVFRHAGDFRCIARTLLELAQPPLTGEPVAAKDLLLASLRAATIASGPAMQARVLARLVQAAASAGDLVLAARCLGVLGVLGTPGGPAGPGYLDPGSGPAADPEPERTLRGPGYATYVSEGRAGGIDLIITLYPR
jgi:predicted ATPase/DNA-binding CsgD family transcriptional regulator